jgi:glycosyltransferase involved in cell wall biosynthesis
MSESYAFTVFTATYNRAHTIKRVFDSLCAQTLRDFEWLVIDDGSTDNTSELIANWAKIAHFPIRYFRQDHSGKHIAHNLAAREARGQFFLVFDSDDACIPRALERIAYYWDMIPPSERSSFYAVDGLCCDQYGKLLGDEFPSNPFDSDLREKYYVYKLRGEKWGAGLTEVIRRYPFPEIKNTHFAPEGMVWLEIAKTYKTRYVNEVLRVYYVDDHATGATLTKKRTLNENAPGRLQNYIWILNNDLEYFFNAPIRFLKAAAMLPIVGHASKQSLWRSLRSLNVRAKALVVMAFPVSALLYIARRIRYAFASE